MTKLGSKELYMMNGGNKSYIYKDGFGDIYNATEAEEREWAKEIIANTLQRLEVEQNPTLLKLLVETLSFHKYERIGELLIEKLNDTSASRQIAFATCLWNISKYEKSFRVIYQNLSQQRDTCIDDVFWSMVDLKDNVEAQKFLVACIEGNDDILHTKAQVTIVMWAYTGMPALRENNLPDQLLLENKNETAFAYAVEQLKKILFNKKK